MMAAMILTKAIQLLGVKAKWISILGTILVSLVLTTVCCYTYDGLVRNHLLDEIIWGEHASTYT